jgi:glycosyltransferase involved in cell wall biosynthesis
MIDADELTTSAEIAQASSRLDGMSASSLRERPRILLAAYHFPPSAAVGGLRISRFARFLPEFGWRTYVLTVNDADRDEKEGTDHTRLVGLDAVSITRTREPSGILDACAWLKRKMQSLWANQQSPSSALVRAPVCSDGRESLSQRLKRYVTSLLVLLPDEHKNWALFAAIPAIRLIQRHRIDFILTSAPPQSVHFVGLVAKVFTRVAWIADFRDPWLELLQARPAHHRSWLSHRLERWMEARVMHNADRVLTTTERMRQSMMARYPTVPADKFSCLPNGIEMARSAGPDSVDKYGPLTITYAGSLYLDRTPEPLFEALGALVNEGKTRLDDFRVKLVGNCRTIGEVETETVARRYGVAPAVEVVDRMPYAEVVPIMRRSHLLLVLAPPKNTLMLPAKIFDYLGSGSKLLALADPGATADLILETDGGKCFSQNDVAGLKKYLHELLKDGAYRSLRNDPVSFRRYDARRLTGQLAAELAEQCGRPVRITVRT